MSGISGGEDEHLKKIRFILLAVAASFIVSCDGVVFDELLHPVCTVLYYDNDCTSGLVPSGPVTYNPGDVITVLGNTGSLARTGYTFNGWNTASDGSGVTYTPGQTFTMGKATVRLYALWTGNPYIITFDSNDGSGSLTYQTISCGSSSMLTANSFTRTGYSFNGWSTTSGGSLEYNDQALYTMGPGNVTLYALWTANPYSITFNANGATSGTMFAQSISYGDSDYINTNQFLRTGYTFAGWSTSLGGAVVYADGQNYTMGTEGATLYAVWTANNYTITFHGNGADGGSMSAQTIACDATDNLTANAFTRTGYNFAGWATTSGGAVSYADNTSYTMGAGDVDLYAQWTINQYTLSFDSQGGTSVTSQTVNYGSYATEPVAPTKTGSTLLGWFTDTTYSTQWNFNGNTITGNRTLYASWTPTVLSVRPYMWPPKGIPLITITGTDFKTGATARITRSGYSDIIASDVTVVSSTIITCHLDLNGAATGAWNVIVTNTDGYSGTLTGGFTVALYSDQIVFSRSANIYKMNSNGTGQAAISSAVGGQGARSPDGYRVVFQGHTGGYNIWVMNLDGSSLVKLTTSNSCQWPAWSPDGAYITYGSSNRLYIMNSDGTNPQLLIGSVGPYTFHGWSPDSKKIIYTISGTLYTSEILNGAATNEVSLGVTGDEPAWSPDGAKIAYTNSTIRTMNSDGTGQLNLNVTGTHPAWSPDGTKIGYVNSGNFYIINATGGTPALITTSVGEPSWAPY